MSHALCLQPWVSIAGTSITVVQNQADWADLLGYESAAIYVEVAAIQNQGTSSTSLIFETAPSADPALFQQYNAIAFAGTPPLGVQAIILPTLWSDTGVPLARFLRWTLIFGTVATNIHFRVWLTLQQAGW